MPRSGDVSPARWAIQRRTGSPWAPRRVSFVVTPAHRASAGRSPTRPQVDPISASGFLRSGGCRLRVRANSGGNGGSTHDTHPRWQPGRRASPRCKEFGPASHAGRRASPRCKEFGPGGRHARGAQARSVHVSREPANGAAGHVRVGIDDEEGGAAVGAAIGTGGGRSPAAHAAHRDGATGHRGGGGTSHHGWVNECPYWLARSAGALCARSRHGGRSVWSAHRTARCREPERIVGSWPGASGGAGMGLTVGCRDG